MEKIRACPLQFRGWLWAYLQIVHEANADGSSSGACVPTCSGGGDSQEWVCGIGLDNLSDFQLLLNIFIPYGQRHGVQLFGSTPLWSWMLRGNSSAAWYGEGTRSFCVTVFNEYPRSPWLRLLLLRTQHRTFKTATCDTPVILDNCPWESQWLKTKQYFQ